MSTLSRYYVRIKIDHETILLEYGKRNDIEFWPLSRDFVNYSILFVGTFSRENMSALKLSVPIMGWSTLGSPPIDLH